MRPTPERVTVRLCGYPASIRIYPAPGGSPFHVVALHGFTGCGADFEPLIRAFGADSPTWICPDFMGHGESASPAVLDPYGLGPTLQLIDQARALSGQPEKTGLLGYSMGGRLALQYLNRAKPLPTLLIGASPGIEDPSERAARRRADAGWCALLLSGDRETFARKWESQPVLRWGRPPSPALRDHLQERRRSQDPVGLAHSLMACGSGVLPALWKDLPELPPAWCLTGSLDERFCGLARRMNALNRRMRLLQVAGCGHAPHLEDPEAVADTMRRSGAFFCH